MRLIYFLNRLRFRISVDRNLKCLKEIIFFNREIILVQKDLKLYESTGLKEDLRYTIVDSKNSKAVEKKHNLQLFDYYAQNNCKTLIAEKENDLVGFIRWTEDNNFSDLKKFKIQMKPKEAYMFDFFLFPKYRGSSAPNDISNYALTYLKKKGIEKFYGFFFSDNLPALWWHRTVLKVNEFKKIRLNKFIIFEWSKGEAK